jgi:hypothetical protein
LFTKIDDIFMSEFNKRAISEEVAKTTPRSSGSIIGIDPNFQRLSDFCFNLQRPYGDLTQLLSYSFRDIQSQT